MSTNVIDIIVNAAKAKADVAALDTEFAGLGKAAAASGIQATAGLSAVEREIEIVRTQTKQYTQAEIERTAAMRAAAQASGNASLADAQRKAALFNQTVALKDAQAAEQGKIMSAVESEAMAQRVAAAERIRAKAAEEAAAADLAAAEASGLSARQMITTAGAASRVAGAAIPGARALGTLAGAFSVASVGQLALIVGAGVLIGELFKLGKATEEVVKIDGDWVAVTAFAISNGSLFLRSTQAQAQSAAALTGSIERVITNQQKLNEENDRGAAIQKKLETATQEAQHSMTVGTVGYGAALTRTAESADTYRKQLIGSADQQSKLTKEVAEGLKGLDAYRSITHQGTDALIEFARQQKYTDEQLDVLRRALDEDVRKMGEFAEQSAKAATHTRSLAEAIVSFNIARATASGPGFSSPQFATAADTAKFAAEIATNLRAAEQEGATFREAVIGQSSALRELQQHLRETTLTQKGYHAELSNLPPLTQQGIAEIGKISAGMKVFADHTKQAQSEARALSLATADLAAKLESAQAARDEAAGVTTSFDQQRANIRTAIDLKRHELEEKHQLTVLNNVNLSALESAQIATVQAKWVEANRLLQERLGEIEAKASAKAADDKIGLLRAEISKRYDIEADYAKRAGFTEKEQAEYLVDVRVALIKEYIGRRSKLEEDGRKHELQTEANLQNALEDERLKSDKATMTRAIKLFKDMKEAERSVGGQIGGSIIRPADEAQVKALIAQIKSLGKAYADAGHDADVVRKAFDAVDKLFGFVGRDARTLALQLKALEQYSKGDAFGGLRTSLKALGSDLINSGKLAMTFAQTLYDGFAQAIGAGENFLASLGAALVRGMTQIIAQQLLQFGMGLIASGTKDILTGVAINANPFTPGMGSALIAAGVAEVAQGVAFGAAGGVVAGLGQLAANKINPQSSATSSTAGAATDGGTGSSRDRAQQPTFINVPSGQQQSANALAGMTLRSPRLGTEIQVTLVNKLDANGTSQFLNGQNVITRHNVASHRKEMRRGLGLAPA